MQGKDIVPESLGLFGVGGEFVNELEFCEQYDDLLDDVADLVDEHCVEIARLRHTDPSELPIPSDGFASVHDAHRFLRQLVEGG